MVEEKKASNQRDLAVFQHIMLENDICTETYSLTLKVLGMPAELQIHANYF